MAGCLGGDGDGGSGEGNDERAQKTPARLETFTNEAGVEVGATWEAVEELAKDEGEFTLYSPTDRSELSIWMQGFHEVYPDIKLNHVTGTPSDLLPRWLTEYKTDNIHADTYSGATGLDVLAKRSQTMKLSSEYLPAYAGIPEKYKNEYIVGVRLKVGSVFFNTNEVEQSAVTSWDDIVTDERWGGGNLGWDPSPNMYLMTALLDMKGRELFENLQQQEPHWVDSHSDLARFCGAGQFSIAYTYSSYLWELPELPIAVFDLPRPAGIAGSVINNKAPHPNAALVFTDYLASDKGQKHLAELSFSILHGSAALPETKNWEINPASPGAEVQETKRTWDEIMDDLSQYTE